MRRSSLPSLLLPLIGLFLLGASCNGTQEQPKGAGDAPEAKVAKIEKLDRVDTSALTDGERRTWVDLVNELLSPCGDPVSVAQCVAESRACSACVPAARYIVRLVSEGYEKSEMQDLYAARYDEKKKVTLDLNDAPVRGAPMAPVTIVEFSDFECPHCGAAHPVLTRVLEEFEGKVNLAFKHYPLDSHPHAKAAARAAVAAQMQGKFWELADKLFENQRQLNDDKIRELAKEAGLDMARFEADFTSQAVADRVERDKKEGASVDVQGTPTLFVNGRPYRESVQSLSKYLKEELAK